MRRVPLWRRAVLWVALAGWSGVAWGLANQHFRIEGVH